jgi:hypothetical protein
MFAIGFVAGSCFGVIVISILAASAYDRGFSDGIIARRIEEVGLSALDKLWTRSK